MKNSKHTRTVIACSIALSLALGGGTLWANQKAHAAEDVGNGELSQSTDNNLTLEARSAKKPHMKFNKGKPGFEMGAISDVFGLTREELKAALGEEKTLADLAAEKNISVDSLVAAATEKTTTILNEKLANGAITQEQYDQYIEKATSSVTSFLHGERSKPDDQAGPNNRPFNKSKGSDHQLGLALDPLATVLDMTVEEIQAELKSGKTVSDVAAEKNIAIDTVLTAGVTNIQEKLQELVDSGEITQEQADQRVQSAEERISNFINGEFKKDGFKKHPSQHKGKQHIHKQQTDEQQSEEQQSEEQQSEEQ